MHVAALYRYSTCRDLQVRGDRARGHDRLSRGTYSVSSPPWGAAVPQIRRLLHPPSRCVGQRHREGWSWVPAMGGILSSELARRSPRKWRLCHLPSSTFEGKTSCAGRDTVLLHYSGGCCCLWTSCVRPSRYGQLLRCICGGTQRPCRVTHLNAQTSPRRNELSSAADARKCNCLEQHVVDYCAQHFLFLFFEGGLSCVLS